MCLCGDRRSRSLGLIDAKQVHEGELILLGIAADRLAKLLLRACHIKDVIYDLERKADTFAVIPCCFDLFVRAAAADAAHLAGGLDQRTGLAKAHGL